MANGKDTRIGDNVTSRRGFLGVAAVGAAATLIPMQTALPCGREEAVGATGWAEAKGMLEPFRAAYLAELERFALTLEPRFRSGELRATRSPEDDQKRIPGTTGWGAECFTSGRSPQDEVGDLCAAHFRVEVTTTVDPEDEGRSWFEGDEATAHLILAVSPHGPFIDDGYDHVAYQARDAIAWDVIALARARGWYVPTETEFGDPIDDTAALRGGEGES